MMGDSFFTPALRMACAFVVGGALTSRAPAASVYPTVVSADSVFVGLVAEVSEVRGPQGSAGHSVWKAEIALESVEKSDVPMIAFATVYFPPGWVGCPMPPNLTRGMRARFFCARSTLEGIGRILWIPESDFVQAAPALSFDPLPLQIGTSLPSCRVVSCIELANCGRPEILRQVEGRLGLDCRAGPPVPRFHFNEP